MRTSEEMEEKYRRLSELSQDDFFRVLNLRSVNASVKLRYRRAIKERLRHSTTSMTTVVPYQKAALSQKSVVRAEEATDDDGKASLLSTFPSSLKPYENFLHPGIKRELLFDDDKSEAKENRIIKKTYYVEKSSSSESFHADYSSRIRIQSCFFSNVSYSRQLRPESLLTPYLLKEELDTKIKENNKSRRNCLLSVCPHCSMSFKSSILLQKHVLSSHKDGSGRKNRFCPICKKSFAHSHCAEVHDKNNLQCLKCNRFFDHKIGLELHLRTEHLPAEALASFSSEDIESKCDICYKIFAKRKNMIRHIKSLHAAEIHRVDLNKFVSLRLKIT